MVKYLNNIVEQDHRLIKRIIKPKLGAVGRKKDEVREENYNIDRLDRKIIN